MSYTHHPLGKDPGNSNLKTKMGDGLIGYFPMEIPLANIIQPTYLSESSMYNYAIDRVANPSSTFGISDAMRWINSSKATKGNVGIKTTEATSLTMPKLYVYGYGCENEFSASMIVNKHGNLTSAYSGATSLYLEFDNMNTLKIEVSNTNITYKYGIINGFDIIPLKTETVLKNTQIEHITVTVKRTAINSTRICIYDSVCEAPLWTFSVADKFVEALFINTAGTYEITNMRAYSKELSIDTIKEICFIGDYKSTIFLNDSDFEFEYDWANERILSTKISTESFPYGTNRAISKGTESIGRGAVDNDGVYSSIFASVLEGVYGLRASDPLLSANVTKEMRPTVEKIASGLEALSTSFSFPSSSDGTTFDNGTVNKNSLFSVHFAKSDFAKIACTNVPYMFNVIHHGYFYMNKASSDDEFVKRMKIDFTKIPTAEFTTFKNSNIFLSKDAGLTECVYANKPVAQSTHVFLSNTGRTSIDIRMYSYDKASKQYVQQGSTVLASTNTQIDITLPTDLGHSDMNSFLIVVYSTGTYNILMCKNVEIYATIISSPNFISTANSSAKNRLTSKGTIPFTIEDINPMYASGISSRHLLLMSRERNGRFQGTSTGLASFYLYSNSAFPKYQKSNTLTYQEKASGYTCSKRTSLNHGVYADITFMYNGYLNYKSAGSINTYTASSESFQYGKNLVNETHYIQKGKLRITNTGHYNLRVVANIDNSTGNIMADYAVGTIIPNAIVDSLKCIVINDRDYIYKPSTAGLNDTYILTIVREAGDVYRFNGYSSFSSLAHNQISSVSVDTNFDNTMEFLIYYNSTTTIVATNINGTSLKSNYVLASPSDIYIKSNKLREVCEYVSDVGTAVDEYSATPFIYLLPKPAIFLSGSQIHSGITSMNKTTYGYVNEATIAETAIVSYAESNYNFTDKLDTYTQDCMYGVNKRTPGNENLIIDGYGWHIDDASENPANISAWKMDIDISASAQIAEFYTTVKANNFVFWLDYLESVDRKTPKFDILSLVAYSNSNEHTVSIRHPITKKVTKHTTYIDGSSITDSMLSVTIVDEDISYKRATGETSGNFLDFKNVSAVKEIEASRIYTDSISLVYHPYGIAEIKEYNNTLATTKITTLGGAYSPAKYISRHDATNNITMKKEPNNLLYKDNSVGKIMISSARRVLSVEFPLIDTSYDLKNVYLDGEEETFYAYGIMTDFNWTSKVSFTLTKAPDIISNNFTINTVLLESYPAIFTGTSIDLYRGNTLISASSYKKLHDVIVDIGNLVKYSYGKFASINEKSWHTLINQTSSDITLTAKDTDTIAIATSSLMNMVGTYSTLLPSGDYSLSQMYNYYILGYTHSTPLEGVGPSLKIEMCILAKMSSVNIYMSGLHEFTVPKTTSLVSPLTNYITYINSFATSIKTGAYSFQIASQVTDNFILESISESTDTYKIKNKRNLDSIVTTVTRAPTTMVTGISTNSSIISELKVYDNVAITESYFESYVKASDDTKNILKQGHSALVYSSADIFFKIKDSLDSDFVYVISGVTYIKTAPYAESTSATKEVLVSIYSRDNLGTADIDGIFIKPYILSLKAEILSFQDRKLLISNSIKFTTSPSITIRAYKNISTGYSLLSQGTGSMELTQTLLGDYNAQNEIKSLKLLEILPTTTYFGTEVIVNKTEIPYNDISMFMSVPDSCSDYYDFCGNQYKEFNKRNMLEACTVTGMSRFTQKIGIQADSILTPYLHLFANGIRQISFLLKFDEKNFMETSDTTFSFNLVTSAGTINLMDSTGLLTTGEYQYIKISFDDAGNCIVKRYGMDGVPVVIKASFVAGVTLSKCKLSIKNSRWVISNIVVLDSDEIDYSYSTIVRLKGMEKITVSNNKYVIPTGKYFYNKDLAHKTKKSEIALDYVNGTSTPTDFLYGKFQEIWGRISNTSLILHDDVFSYRNTPSSNKILSANELAINNNALNVSFDIYVQKLGVNELNNPVVFLEELSAGIFTKASSVPSTIDKLMLVGCLVSDDSYDSLEMQSFMEYDSFSYNTKLPSSYTYPSGSIAILGRQLVLIDSIIGTVTLENKTYRVLKLNSTNMVAGNGYKQKFYPTHVEGENIRSVYDISSITDSYEFSDAIVDGESDIYKPSRASGSVTFKDKISKFNKFGSKTDKYSIDKGCCVYLFEGHVDNTILQSTSFIDTMFTNPKEETIQISTKNKVDLIYDKKIVNYKTFENNTIKNALIQALFPYFYMSDDMVVYSSSMMFCGNEFPSIKTIDFSSYSRVGDIFDMICSCGFNMWIDDMERLVIDTDIESKFIHGDFKVEYDNGKNSDLSYGNVGYRQSNITTIDNIDDLVDDLTVSEKDSLIVNKIELAHENTVPMYNRAEYVQGDKIYPINNIGLPVACTDTISDNIVYLDKTGLIKPKLLSLYKDIAPFNTLKMKTGVMCVVRRGDYELQYKFIQAKKESI